MAEVDNDPAQVKRWSEDRSVNSGARFPFTPYFNGWYRLAASRDVKVRQIFRAKAFGRDLVAFRDKAGNVSVLEAHCPHLGANLGLGRVVDGTLVCPFHGWRFNGGGRCVQVPNSNHLPRSAVKSYPAVELDGAVLTWFEADGSPPSWTPEPAPRGDGRKWTRFRPGRERRVETHVQELCENGVDLAHFSKVHSFHIQSAVSTHFSVEEHRLNHKISQDLSLFGLSKLGLKNQGHLEFAYQGVGILTVTASTPGVMATEFLTRLYFTPIDAASCQVSADYSVKLAGPVTPVLFALSMLGAEAAIESDLMLMATKIYRDHPTLSEADGPILQFRRWASQFY